MESMDQWHQRIHKEAAAKVWHHGAWRVAPLTKEHRDNMVIEFVRRKFKDQAIWVSAESIEAGFTPDFDDHSKHRLATAP